MRLFVLLVLTSWFLGCSQNEFREAANAEGATHQSVFVGTLAAVDQVDIQEDASLLKAILQHQGMGEFETRKESPLPPMVMVRRGLTDNEERIILPQEFVQNSLGGRLDLNDGDLVLFIDALDCSAFSLGAPETGKSFFVKGLVNQPGQYETGTTGSKIEDIRTEALAGKSTRAENSFDLVIFRTTATDGVPETYFLPLERPYFEKLYLKVRIQEGDVIEFVDGKEYFQP